MPGTTKASGPGSCSHQVVTKGYWRFSNHIFSFDLIIQTLDLILQVSPPPDVSSHLLNALFHPQNIWYHLILRNSVQEFIAFLYFCISDNPVPSSANVTGNLSSVSPTSPARRRKLCAGTYTLVWFKQSWHDMTLKSWLCPEKKAMSWYTQTKFEQA